MSASSAGANAEIPAIRGVLGGSASGLDAFFKPATVALIGATDRQGSVGREVLRNLTAHFKGHIFPVNPARATLLDLPCFKSIADVPPPVDLVVIVTPAESVPSLVRDCASAGVKAVVVISAGFKEAGDHGKQLEQQIKEAIRGNPIRLIGPNCLGVMNPHHGLNATFAQSTGTPGSVAFISQSGALLTAILDWSHESSVGFSGIVSTGSMADVGWSELIDYYGNDAHTRSILLYLESVGDARGFVSALREAALSTPVIVVKAGRSQEAAKAAASHTGSMTGSDDVFEAALHRCGALRVDGVSELFAMADVLAKQPRAQGPRLTIVTNAGGPAILAADALIANGGKLATLPTETLQALNEVLPPHWSHGNPVDILGDAGPERLKQVLEIATKNSQSDGLLVILAPQGMSDFKVAAEQLVPFAHATGKPVLASWMGGPTVAAAQATLNHAGIPSFAFPDDAAKAFAMLWRYSGDLQNLYETPSLRDRELANEVEAAEAIVAEARKAQRSFLTEYESKKVLELYGIPTVPTEIATDEETAVSIAQQTGYPVVLKLHSETITHKTDVGGVKLRLKDAAAVRRAFNEIKSSPKLTTPNDFQGVTVQPMIDLRGSELLLGSSTDPQFGPVIVFGSGGTMVEVHKDRALALPPLNSTLAQRLIERTKIYSALQKPREGKAVDLAGLHDLLVRFSRLVVELRWIKEIDINPLIADGEKFVALDARIVLHGPEVKEADLPRSAIRPYPEQYSGKWQAHGGTEILFRPIRPEDEPLIRAFHSRLSLETVQRRYLHPISLDARTTHERLLRTCFVDYDREFVLVALHPDEDGGDQQIVAVGRLSRDRTQKERGEFAVVVADSFQGRGIGTKLMTWLIEIGHKEGIRKLTAAMFNSNTPMVGLARRFGFQFALEDGIVTATREI